MTSFLKWAVSFVQFSVEHFPDFLKAAGLTVEITLLTFGIGLVLGTILAFMRISKSRVLQVFATGYIELFRGTPLMVQLYFIYFGLPDMGLKFNQFQAAVIAISLNEAAYIAELVRGAIQSIDKGQMEAARSLGMSYSQAMRRVIVPQSFRRLLPPLVNEIVALTKNTSLVSVLGLAELTLMGKRLQNTLAIVWPTWFWVALFYMVMSLICTRVAARLEAKLEAME